jgi:hypothetical protein
MPFEKTLGDRLLGLEIRNSEVDALYLQTYPLFLDFFAKRIAVEHLEPNDAKIAVVLVYSWMGRAWIEPACWKSFASASTALPRMRANAPDKQAIEAIKSFVGDSLIATSKFLHFLDPEKYAIWDRNVAWAAYRYEYPYQYNRIDRYLEYLIDLQELDIDERACQQVRGVLGTQVTPLRMKEFALFHLGISELTE